MFKRDRKTISDVWQSASPPVARLLTLATRPRGNAGDKRQAAIRELSQLHLVADDEALVTRTLRRILQGHYRLPKRWSTLRAIYQPLLVTLPVGLLIGAALATNSVSHTWLVEQFLGVTVLATLAGELLTVPFWLPHRLAADSMDENRVRATAVEVLGQRGAKSEITEIAKATTDISPGVRSAAVAALLHMLPQVSGEETYLKNAETSYELGRALYKADEPLAVEILKALQKVGTGAALKYVEHAAQSLPSAESRRLASDVFLTLLARQNLDDERVRLLRAADAADDVLLRPAGAATEAEKSVLLRAEMGDG